MRQVVLSDEASQQLENQINFLLDRNSLQAAKALRKRFGEFLSSTLSMFPGTGHYVASRNLWESWVPKTRMIVWYQFDDATLTVITVWHSAQDREADET